MTSYDLGPGFTQRECKLMSIADELDLCLQSMGQMPLNEVETSLIDDVTATVFKMRRASAARKEKERPVRTRPLRQTL